MRLLLKVFCAQESIIMKKVKKVKNCIFLGAKISNSQ